MNTALEMLTLVLDRKVFPRFIFGVVALIALFLALAATLFVLDHVLAHFSR